MVAVPLHFAQYRSAAAALLCSTLLLFSSFTFFSNPYLQFCALHMLLCFLEKAVELNPMESNASMHSFESESVPIHLDSTLPTVSDNSFQATSPQVRPPISRRRSRSDVWRYFTRNDEDPNEPTTTCDYCGKVLLCHPKKQGTSSLKYHVEKCKALHAAIGARRDNPQLKETWARRTGVDGTTSSPNVGPAKYNEQKIRLAIAKMIIKDELPFNFVEKEGFQDFMAVVEPRFPIPSRITVMRDCMNVYLLEKEKLKTMFIESDYKICITTDMWTSVQNLNYMCITAHFVDEDWTLHKRIIHFKKAPNHKGITIGREIESSILEWNIKKIFTITVDNASANNTAIDYLRRIAKFRDCMVLDKELMHIRCCAHILNLIVKDGLTEVSTSVVKIRHAVKYVKSSPARLDKFKSCVDKQNILGGGLLCLDVSTRWNSTYLMLSSALKHYAAFEVLQDEDGDFVPYLCEVGCEVLTLQDWETIKVFVRFLKIFYDMTLRVSGSVYATSNLFIREIFAIYNHLKKISRSESNMLKSMSEKMMLKYDKYWGDLIKLNKMLYIAAMLDPRNKLEVLEFCFTNVIGHERGSELVGGLKRMLEQMYKKYSKSSVDSSMSQSSIGRDETQSNTFCDDDDENILDMFFQHKSSMGVEESKTELDKYFTESVERMTPDFNILLWWKMNSARFPILAKIARDVLAIPVSTVASESAFSAGGRVLDSFRSSLAPTTVEALICTQNWLKAPSVNYDSQDVMEDVESYKLETEITLQNILNEID